MGDGDGVIRLWELGSGHLLRDFRGHRRGILRLALSPDGKALASGGWEKEVRLWDMASGKELHRLGDHNWVKTLAFARGGRWLLSAEGGPPVYVWDLATGKELHRLEGEPADFFRRPLQVDADGQGFAYLDGLLVYRRWKLRGDRPVCVEKKDLHTVFPGTNGMLIRQAALLAPGRDVLLEGPRRIWVLAMDAGRMHPLPEGWYCASLACSPSGRLVALGGEEGKIRIAELASRRLVATLVSGPLDNFSSLAFAPGGRFLASGNSNGTVLLWDLDRALGVPEVSPRDDKALERLWEGLANPDPAAAYQALGRLARAPSTPGFLRARLAPPDPATRRRIARLIRQLDNDDFDLRERAQADLGQLVERAEVALRQALAGNPGPELRERLERLLKGMDSSAERVRRGRVLELLERLGGREGKELLDTLLEHAPAAWQRQQAKEALQRLRWRTAAPGPRR